MAAMLLSVPIAVQGVEDTFDEELIERYDIGVLEGEEAVEELLSQPDVAYEIFTFICDGEEYRVCIVSNEKCVPLDIGFGSTMAMRTIVAPESLPTDSELREALTEYMYSLVPPTGRFGAFGTMNGKTGFQRFSGLEDS